MCDPITAGIGFGLATAGFGTMQAVGQHQQQAASVARSNAIAQQNYQRQLQIAAATDQEKGRVYKAQLNSANAAKNAYYRQLQANQAEASRASVAEQRKLNEQNKKALFDQQTAVAAAVKAQGQVLSTGTSGQSFLLQAMEADRQLGFEMAQIQETLYDASLASDSAQYGILLDQHSANVDAYNNLPANPLAPTAEFLPVKPILASGPSKLALFGAIGGSVLEGAKAGLALGDRLETGPGN
jgi:hypothetical protein